MRTTPPTDMPWMARPRAQWESIATAVDGAASYIQITGDSPFARQTVGTLSAFAAEVRALLGMGRSTDERTFPFAAAHAPSSSRLTIEERIRLATIAKERHRARVSCERPRTCGACHFWSGYIGALEELAAGSEPVMRKAPDSTAPTSRHAIGSLAHGEEQPS